MIVISNTSPIINLATIGQLDLLNQLYSKLIIPAAVYQDIVIAGAGRLKFNLFRLTLAGASEHKKSYA